MRRLTLYGDSDLGLLRIVTSDIRLLSLVIARQILYLSAPVRSIALNPQRLYPPPPSSIYFAECDQPIVRGGLFSR